VICRNDWRKRERESFVEDFGRLVPLVRRVGDLPKVGTEVWRKRWDRVIQKMPGKTSLVKNNWDLVKSQASEFFKAQSRHSNRDDGYKNDKVGVKRPTKCLKKSLDKEPDLF
jgi:hypothetical protein